MKLEYTLAFADYKFAYRLHYRQTLARRLRIAFWDVAVPVLAVIGLAAFIFLDLPRHTNHAAILFGIECSLLWIAIVNPIARHFKMKKCFNQLFPPARADRSSALEVNDDFLLSGIPGVSEGKFSWNAVVDFAQDDNVTLIYISKTRFLFFPTAAMSNEERAELNELVARNPKKR